MKTLANINDNINIKFNKTMTTISENAESQQVAGNRAEEMMASAIAHDVRGRTKTPKGIKEMKRL